MPQALVGFIATLGVPGLVTASGSLTLLGSAVAGAIGIGASFAINALFGQRASIKPQDGRGVYRQSVAVRRKSYGTVLTGGSMVFFETLNGRLEEVIYQGEGPTQAFLEHYLDQRPIELDVDGYVQAKPYLGAVRIEMRKGLATESYFDSLAAIFPTIYGPNHRGDGCISVHLTGRSVKLSRFNSVYPNRLPAYESVRRDGEAYDPRTGVTAWTANLPLILRDYLINADGLSIDRDHIDDLDFARAADVGDQIITTANGGSVFRYHGQLSYYLDAEPADIIERMCVATDGRLYLKSNGKIGFLAGEWIEPTVYIPDGVLRSYDLSDGSGPLREANEVVVKYTNPLARYSEATCDPWRDEDDISRSGKVKSIPVEAYEIQNHHHARRVAKLLARRSNPEWQGTIVTDLYGMKAWEQRFIYLECTDLWDGYLAFEVKSIDLDEESMSVNIEIVSVTAEMYKLGFAEEGTPPKTPVSVDDDTLNAPTGLIVVGDQRVVSGQGKVALISATWDAYPDRDDLTAQAQISIADAEDWSAVSVFDDDIHAEAIGLEDGAFYDFRVRWVKPGGTASEWALWENVKAISDPTAPSSLAFFTLTGVSPRLGNVGFQFKTANDNHLSTVRLYRKPPGVPLDLTTDIKVAELFVGPSSTYSITDGDPSRFNLLSNSPFDTDTVWTKGTGWTIAGGVATHAAGTNSSVYQSVSPVTGSTYRYSVSVSGITAGGAAARFGGGTTVSGPTYTANGAYLGSLVAASGNNIFGVNGSTSFAGNVDDVFLYLQTPDCVPQGVWDYYAVPFNGSGVNGTPLGPVTVTII